MGPERLAPVDPALPALEQGLTVACTLGVCIDRLQRSTEYIGYDLSYSRAGGDVFPATWRRMYDRDWKSQEAAVGQSEDYAGPTVLGGTIQPVYLAFCIAESMAVQLSTMEKIITEFSDEIAANPLLGAHVRLSVIAFGARVETIFPLSDPTSLLRVPHLTAGGQSTYGPLFESLRSSCLRDRRLLRMQGTKPRRPMIFLFPGGRPVDPTWKAHYEHLLDDTAAIVVGVFLESSSDTSVRRRLRWSYDVENSSEASILLAESLNSLTHSTSIASLQAKSNEPISNLENGNANTV